MVGLQRSGIVCGGVPRLFFCLFFSIRCMRYIKLVFVHEASHTVNKDVHTAKLFQDLIHSSHDAVGLPHVDTQWKTAPP